jgi:hypothetical protein
MNWGQRRLADLGLDLINPFADVLPTSPSPR